MTHENRFSLQLDSTLSAINGPSGLFWEAQ